MTSWVTKVYPFLLAFIPILHYAANNPDQYGTRDLVFLLAITAAACGVVYGLTWLVARGRAAAGLPAFVTLLYVAWFYGYRRIAGILTGNPADPPHAILVPVGLLLCGMLVWWVWRRERLLEGLGRFLTLMSALMVGYSLFKTGNGWLKGRNAIADSAVARELARPIEGPATVPEPRRDVYLIVLDEYANSDILRERFGYDNGPFEDSLRALGFHVPELVRSNYLHTLLSLPSLLNTSHLYGLGEELGPESKHPALPNHLVEHNRVARYLKERGYEYVFFPSDWWHSTGGSTEADVVFRPWSGFDFMRAMGGGELERTVRGATILSYFNRTHRWEADHTRRTLEALAALPGTGDSPRFVFAHILKPHSPYVFDRDCNTLRRQKEDDDVGPYLEQVECVNRMVLGTVRRILEASEVPPIILLQGDHGTKLLHAIAYTSAEEVPPAAARERFGAFGAYYLPDGGAEAFGDTVTVVNVLGNVLRYYFGARLPPSGNEQYISPAQKPYDFRRVDARWLAGDGSAAPKARAGG
ncbi:MAG TPA: sulfatase-like hydrolase/transferase [Gemmatimonadales bacterium]|nr:sulfatase-like hydrolase/transferase [Gemmatimonadales bacterium]